MDEVEVAGRLRRVDSDLSLELVAGRGKQGKAIARDGENAGDDNVERPSALLGGGDSEASVRPSDSANRTPASGSSPHSQA